MKMYAVSGKFSRGSFERVFFDKGEFERWWEDYADSDTSCAVYDVHPMDYVEPVKVWCVTFDLNDDTIVNIYRGSAKAKAGVTELWPRKYPFRVSFHVEALTRNDAVRAAAAMYRDYVANREMENKDK